MDYYIECNGKQYELKFNLERLKLIENSIKKPVLSVYIERQGAFTIEEMEKIFLISLKEVGSDFFCSNKEAKDIFNAVIQQENGYRDINNYISLRLQENCPFLFPKA